VPEGEIKTLLATAINLHQNAVVDYRVRRWWITQVISPVASFGGALFGVHLKGG
jgi:hypothetical protein